MMAKEKGTLFGEIICDTVLEWVIVQILESDDMNSSPDSTI